MFRRATAAILAAIAAGPLIAQPLVNALVRLESVPFSETVHGTKVEDPYRWVESADQAGQVALFIRESSAPTIAALKALSGYGALHDAVDAASQAGVRFAGLQSANGLLFYRRTERGAQLAKLVVRSSDGVERVLYDPANPSEAGAGAINSFSISPSGKTVAIHTAEGGSEVGVIRFIDTASGTVLPDKLAPVFGEFEVEWIDEERFTYTRMAETGQGDAMQNMRVFLGKLGGGGGVPLLGGGVSAGIEFPPEDFPGIEWEADSRWVFAYGTGARADARLFVAAREGVIAGKPVWREVAGLSDQLSYAALVGDTLFALSTKRSPNGELVAIDLSNDHTAANASVVVPASDIVLAELAGARDGLYLRGHTDGLSRLLFVHKGNLGLTELKLPMRGTIAGLRRVEGGEGVTFAMHDWFTSLRWFSSAKGNIQPLGLDSASYELAGARQLRELAKSADGTMVPLDILLPPGAEAGKPLPLLLEGYGSYGVNTAEPFYLSYRLGMLKQSGALAFCGIRGGGERGRSWHEAGREANKPNAHADLIACGERLVELGWTSPSRMTVTGTSAGGLLAPPAAMKRPDLFSGLIANVAVLNPSRLAAANNGPNQFTEMGDPNTATGFKALMAQDSYQMLLTAKDLPDTMLVVGLNDKRVDPWMSAKFAGRALERFGGRRLVLVRTDPNAGHGIGSGRSQLVDQYSDMFAFVLNQASAPGFESQPAASAAAGR